LRGGIAARRLDILKDGVEREIFLLFGEYRSRSGVSHTNRNKIIGKKKSEHKA